MDVLNTFGGGSAPVLVLLGMFLLGVAVFTFCFVIAAVNDDSYGFVAIFAVLAVVAVNIAALCFNLREPVQHEVTLRPGYVIDAAKYEIVEQRGQIYVIEEREGAE
ncbi:hypothetical protein DFP94_101505 [Fontibacillus phaseoli]|uniref:Uncharacterized protein n=1 Tax=Fontibacillus phaseoli TaxID=1416533 RepID=A0A369BQP1_9BACL|nr:hypothetical protein [Fontibacillus phaseoli]RCX22916.1 hypothetical protein DFP94_101505 [Fontibacillus phaseoli]